MAPASFDPQLMKGVILQYCKGLIVSIKNNHSLVEQFFLSEPSRHENLKHHVLQPGEFFLLEKISLEELSSTLLKRPHQVLLTNFCAAKLQGTDS